MPTSLSQFRVFFASPGGLSEERSIFRNRLRRFSELHAVLRGVSFEPASWEDTLGGIGRPQTLINEDLEQCDYAVFVLHDRWGSPTGNGYASGVEEEWAVAEKLYATNKIRNIAIFFKSVASSKLSDPGEQLRAVLAFKKRIEEGKRYLFRQYDNVDQFADMLDLQLAQWLQVASPSLEAVPHQLPQAYVFGGDESVPIDLVDPPGDGILDSLDQRQSHADILQKAADLITSCLNSNRLGGIKNYASRLVQTMGQSLQELQVRAFWAQMNSLRRRLEADDQIQGKDDPEDPPLPAIVAAQLRDLVDTLNIFAAHEPKLIELDELKSDPAGRVASPATIAAAQQLIANAAQASQVLRKEASDKLLEAEVQTLGGSSPASDRAKQFFVRSARNLGLELIRRAYKGILSESANMTKGTREGAYRMIGAVSASYALAMLIKSNELAVRSLINSLGGSTTLNHIIDLIVRSLS